MNASTRCSLAGIRQAAVNLDTIVSNTPLVRSELLSRALDADVWLKNETVTPISSFKIRGAANAAILAREGDSEGLVTSSTGNHGQGVAYAGRLLGMPADIFLPNPANALKAGMIRAFGGTVHEIGEDFDIAKEAALAYAAERGLSFVNDGEDASVMDGAGTIGLEICNQLENPDIVLIPMGGGNLASGCCTAIKALSPSTRVISIQAKGSPALTESFRQGKALERPCRTVADGLITRVPPKLALETLLEHLDDAWLESDDNLLSGVRDLVESAHVLVEPAGAAALAGACSHRELVAGRKVVMVLTGSNISRELLGRAMDYPSRLAG